MREPVAIIGMACVFPGAPDLETYWRNLRTGLDAISDVPAGRWDPVFYDPASSAVDRLYCRRGGFIDAYATVDVRGAGVMPAAADGTEPDQLLALEAATRALADAGYEDRSFPRHRTSVILGRGNYQTPGMTRADQVVRAAQQLTESMHAFVPGASDAALAALKADFHRQVGPYGPDTAIGLVPNLAASRISNRLDLRGPAYTVDAACASALVAVDHACRDLNDHRVDLAICGGVHVAQDVTFWSVFCQLGALSRSQQIRPFDRRADGLLLGEGIGIVVLKRLADAERCDDRIYAVIRGVGVSSDGSSAGLMTPGVEGQILAFERAWQAAGLDPQTVDFVEAHGTATPAGDDAELTTLGRFFGACSNGDRRVPVGSVKSMIGHTMPAAGAAGLIKAALALHHGVLPPSLHCEDPHPKLTATRFRIADAEEAVEPTGRMARAGVNAFGFGGTDAHVVLEAHARPAPRRQRSVRSGIARPADEERMIVKAADSADALIRALDTDSAAVGEGPWRLTLADPTPERRALARAIVLRGHPRRGRDGIWFSPAGLASDGGRVAFLFPGIEAAFRPRVEDVAAHFDLPIPRVPDTDDLEEVGAAVISVGRLLHDALAGIGVRPDVVAGHSIGEWTGMVASGMLSSAEVGVFVEGLTPGSLTMPDVGFAAAGCDAARAAGLLAGIDDVVLSHDNCPHQIILCGPAERLGEALGRLRAAGVLCQKLPFRSGFHSAVFADHLALHRRHVEQLPFRPARVPLWSATTCQPYPADVDAIRSLTLDHLVKPVQFRRLVLALYDAGVRVFVQMGTGSLASFVEDTLRDRAHFAMSAASAERSGMTQIRRLAGALFVEGVPIDFRRLGLPRPETPSLKRTLALGVPLVRLRAAEGLRGGSESAAASDPVLAAFDAVMRDVVAARESILHAWEAAKEPSPVRPPARDRGTVQRRTLSIGTFPELGDHCLFEQPRGWPSWPDRYPVVPLTTSIALLIDAARELAPDRVVVAVEDVRAQRWIAVAPPVDVAIRLRWSGSDRVSAGIDGYVDATLRLAPGYPPAPEPRESTFAGEAPAPVTADAFYRDRWMFHGPSFQGVVGVGPIATGGIRGTIEVQPAPGSLLDNAGQLFGFWVMLQAETDRLAMPVRIDRLELFGSEPPVGSRLDATVRIRRLDPASARADIDLTSGGSLWARVTGWEDRRFETDESLWRVLREPEKHALAVIRPGGYVFLHDRWRTAQSRDFLMRRYLGERERAEYAETGLQRQRAWLAVRVAAKDAVRHWLWARGHGDLFPVEVSIEEQPGGSFRARGPFSGPVSLAVAHSHDVAVAAVAGQGAAGIDLERVPQDGDARGAMIRAAQRAVSRARGSAADDHATHLPFRESGGVIEVDGVRASACIDGAWAVAWTGE